MSDVMLCGILRMPFDHGNDLHLMQLQQACREAASELERRADEISAQSAEIARLRKAVEKIVKHAENKGMRDWPIFKDARAALETKG